MTWPWLSAVIAVWLVVGFFAYTWVMDLELFPTYYTPSGTEPILSELVAAAAATLVTTTLAGLVVLLSNGRRSWRGTENIASR
jgi:fatty acid desaturase